MEPQRLTEDGFTLLPGVLTPAWTEQLAARIPGWALLPGARQRHGVTFAVSNVLQGDPELRGVLGACGVTRLVSEALGRNVVPIDALFFDKIPESNWKVPGHQDVVMPIAALVEADGFSGLTMRHGASYGQPPDDVLQDLVAARLHLDDSSPDNGPLAVVPGSHRRRFTDRELAEIPPDQYRVCPASAGDLLLMRPLLVHRSAPSATPRHRRVLHVVYAWREAGERVRWVAWDNA